MYVCMRETEKERESESESLSSEVENVRAIRLRLLHVLVGFLL